MLNGKPMYQHLTDRLNRIEAENFTVGERIVVSQYEELLESLGRESYCGVRNEKPELGISYSIRLGLEALAKQNVKPEDAVCFFVCDQPYLERKTIQNFLEGYLASGRGIGCVGNRHRLGNPVVFRMQYREELMALIGDTGGKKIVKEHLSDTYVYREGYRVLVLEIGKPACIRRQVAYGEAVYDGQAEVEGVRATKISRLEERTHCWELGEIPVFADAEGKSIECIRPDVVVDAIIAKKNLGTYKNMAPLTIALGPGFTAGEDVDVVVETMRGETLGKVYYEGSALPNTGIPGMVGGYAKERVIHAPADGKLRAVRRVGETVEKGEILAYVGETPVYATLDGILRGLIRDGFEVKQGLKIMDIDPRYEELEQCFHISDKAKKIANGVYETIRQWEETQWNCIER
mgnify:CR=1 FL=1